MSRSSTLDQKGIQSQMLYQVFFLHFFFQKKQSLAFHVKQTIHMKFQALFSLKKLELSKLRLSLALLELSIVNGHLSIIGIKHGFFMH